MYMHRSIFIYVGCTAQVLTVPTPPPPWRLYIHVRHSLIQ